MSKSRNDYNRNRFGAELKKKDLKNNKTLRHGTKQQLKDLVEHDYNEDDFFSINNMYS